MKLLPILLLSLCAAVAPAKADVLVFTGTGKATSADSDTAAVPIPAKLTIVTDVATLQSRIIIATSVFGQKQVRTSSTAASVAKTEVKKGHGVQTNVTSATTSYSNSTNFNYLFVRLLGTRGSLQAGVDAEPVLLPSTLTGSVTVVDESQVETLSVTTKFSKTTSQNYNTSKLTLDEAVAAVIKTYTDKNYTNAGSF